MKANYENWVPKGMATGFAAGAAALAAGSVGFAVFGRGKVDRHGRRQVYEPRRGIDDVPDRLGDTLRGEMSMTRREQIAGAYRFLGGKESGFYDGMMTCSTLPGKAICRLVWNMDRERNLAYLERALSGVPENFAGKLLEVPVGTGVLTMPVYNGLPDAEITCLDYSEAMMAAAKRRAAGAGIRNVTFVRGDMGALPFADESFDVVLSLNGFHAFPDKDAVYRETHRVLKPGGTFCGCFYIQGQNRRTDWFIRKIYQPRGFFTPPYETLASLRRRLTGMYSQTEVSAVEGIGCFRCVK